MKKMKQVELVLEHFMFASRWLLVPFYIGLVAAVALLLVKFGNAFIMLMPVVFAGDNNAALLGILTLVDITLVANLLLIIIFAGYENFVSKIDTGDNEDRPDDKIFTDNGVKVVVDKKSFLYLIGTTLDFSGGLNGKGFIFSNPNAGRTCGCGESFSV